MPRNGERPGRARPNQPPPGGTAGAAQQTAATLPLMVIGATGRSPFRGSQFAAPRRRKRRKSTARAATRRAPKRAKRSKRAHLVRGSAAAKRYMAKLRRMQKRRR